MAARSSYITNEIIITAMDRFVWFILLVVISHLVTEFTRVTGFTSGFQDAAKSAMNDSLTQAKQVQNLVNFAGQEFADEQQLQRPLSADNHYSSSSSSSGNNAANNNQAGGFSFSLRPIIDSIFEIPISTLRAVNSLVARLTGSGTEQTTPSTIFSSFFPLPRIRLAAKQAEEPVAAVVHASSNVKSSRNPIKRSILREVNA